MKRITYLIILLFTFSGNVIASDLNKISLDDMVNSSKLNPKLSIPKEIGIGVSRVFLGHWSRLHTSDKVDLIDEFSKKIGENNIQDLIDNNFIKILKISEKNVDAVYISTEITFTNIPSEPKAIKFYTINPQNYNWYADKRSNTYPSIFVFDNTSLAYDLEVFYIYYDKLGERQSEEILIRKKNEIISFFSRRNKVSYVILPYYEFEIPFNKAENGENSLIIRYAISENLIFTGGGITGDGFLNYSNNESVGFMEIERY